MNEIHGADKEWQTKTSPMNENNVIFFYEKNSFRYSTVSIFFYYYCCCLVQSITSAR